MGRHGYSSSSIPRANVDSSRAVLPTGPAQGVVSEVSEKVEVRPGVIWERGDQAPGCPGFRP